MTKYERYMTIKNVISDLEHIIRQADDNRLGHTQQLSGALWHDAQLAAEYITTNRPNL